MPWGKSIRALFRENETETRTHTIEEQEREGVPPHRNIRNRRLTHIPQHSTAAHLIHAPHNKQEGILTTVLTAATTFTSQHNKHNSHAWNIVLYII